MICGIQIGHNPSVCVYDKEIIYYNEERKLSKQKHITGIPYYCLNQLAEKKLKIDLFTSTSYNYDEEELINLKAFLNFKKLFNTNKNIHCWYTPHHLNHLFKSFIDSGFTQARVFVIDGRGSDWYLEDKSQVYETTSVYDINHNEVKCIYKKLFSKFNSGKINKSYHPNNNRSYEKHNPPLVNEKTIFDVRNEFDLGNFYSEVSRKFGFEYEEGKFMGFQSYGKSIDNLNVLDIENLDINFNVAASCQKYFEDEYLKIVDKFAKKDMVFTGGTALNVVNNYKIKQKFKQSNLFFDPLCGDEGTSIGAVYSYMYSKKLKPKPLDNIYLGEIIKTPSNLDSCNLEEVINILKDGNVIGLIQGKAEAGPRALGNRSLLLDPTKKNCKEIMNEIKQRENFRPFACSITESAAQEFFYMEGIRKSPYMMYAPQAKEKAKVMIPGIIHVDGTCRIQTVTEEENKVLFTLLQKFKLPILMNTSFNLAGYPIVESIEDVLFTLRNSSLKYVYFADEKKLLIKDA